MRVLTYHGSGTIEYWAEKIACWELPCRRLICTNRVWTMQYFFHWTNNEHDCDLLLACLPRQRQAGYSGYYGFPLCNLSTEKCPIDFCLHRVSKTADWAATRRQSNTTEYVNFIYVFYEAVMSFEMHTFAIYSFASAVKQTFPIRGMPW